MTAIKFFETMLSRLEPTIIQKRAIQTTRETIDSVLKNSPKISLVTQRQASFLTGSYRRNTLIRPIQDIDLYVVVHYRQHVLGEKPIKVMRLIARSLRNRYSQTKIQVDSPCIVIKFIGYKFEVVPAVYYTNDPERYMIPKDTSDLNNKKFVPLIKILKQWCRNNNVKLKSFHLELLTGRVFDKVKEIYSYPQAVYEWMYYVSTWIHENNSPFVPEPGKFFPFVDTYLYQNRLKLHLVRKKLKEGLRKADLAYTKYLDGKENHAKRIWLRMFGEMFPAPLPLPTKARLVQPELLPLGRLVPPKPLPLLGQNVLSTFPPPSKPSLLGMALRENPKDRLNSLSNTPLLEQPKHTRNALFELWAGPKKPFLWDK
jgi:hypothetical protein